MVEFAYQCSTLREALPARRGALSLPGLCARRIVRACRSSACSRREFDYGAIRKKFRKTRARLESVLRGRAGILPALRDGHHAVLPRGGARARARLPQRLAQERRPQPQRLAERPRLVPRRGRGQSPEGAHGRDRLHRQRRQRPRGGLRRRRQTGAHLRARKRPEGETRPDDPLRRVRRAGPGHLRRRLPAVPRIHRGPRRPEPQHRLSSADHRGKEDRRAGNLAAKRVARARTPSSCRWATASSSPGSTRRSRICRRRA